MKSLTLVLLILICCLWRTGHGFGVGPAQSPLMVSSFGLSHGSGTPSNMQEPKKKKRNTKVVTLGGTKGSSMVSHDTCNQSKINQLLLEAVLTLPQLNEGEGKRLVHLSIVGSRSKQLASRDSDYDVKAVILHSTTDYMLQDITPSQSFKTSTAMNGEVDLVEVEGTLVDYLTMQKYVLASNQAAYYALQGQTIYETKESEQLEELFQKAYSPITLAKSYIGLLRHQCKKAHKGGTNGGGRNRNIKLVADMVYYASMVHLLATSNDTGPKGPLPQDAFALLEKLNTIPDHLRQQIQSLYEERMEDKSCEVDPEPFASFIEEASEMELPTKRPKKNATEIKELQAKAKQTFLGIME